ncbi:AraC family transcriptional regulator [Thalassotalea fusca]
MQKTHKAKYSVTINKIAQYIYDNFEHSITLTDLADTFGVSKYHLNRLFFAHTGMNLGEFIQRRRLEFAYSLLAEQKFSVIDVAIRVGYDSHAAFSRAFNRLFAIEPSQVKSNSVPAFALAKLIKQPKRQTIQAELLSLPEQKIIGLYGQGFEEQSYFSVATQLYQQIAETLRLSNGFDFSHHQLFGVSIDNPWRVEQSQSRFFAGISSPLFEDMTPSGAESLQEYLMPAGLWARFEHEGSYQTMWQTILNIYASWFSENSYTLRDSALVQHYVNDVTVTPTNELVTHIYVPISKNS